MIDVGVVQCTGPDGIWSGQNFVYSSIHLQHMLDKIQGKGLAYRERSISDQRVVRLYLTEKDSTLLAKAPQPAQGALVDVLLRLPVEVLSELEFGLNQFVDALKVIDKKAGMLPITE